MTPRLQDTTRHLESIGALSGSTTINVIEEAKRHQSRNKIDQYYPETGPLRRELYPKHMAAFEAGATHRERAVVGGNRIGKSEGIGCYELACHLTGRYPKWWKGRRFDKPINAWAAGNTNFTTRDILQAKLLGKMKREGTENISAAIGLGTGLVPADCIQNVRPKSGIPDAIETAYIRHSSGGLSVLNFKSYESGRENFEGVEVSFILFDEEPPLDVFVEAILRTMGTTGFSGGLILITFTPLKGWTDVIAKFFDEDDRKSANRFMVQIEWDDVPHLSDSEKAALLSTIPAYQRDARSKGIPQLGSGAIYPIPESEFVVDPFEIPKHWPRVFGMDVGWNVTAAIWLARDREADRIFAYSEMYAKQEDQHADTVKAIKSRGDWIPGVIDPASRGRSQRDGVALIDVYRDLGLNLDMADNAREAGIHDVRSKMEAGQLKVFKSLVNFLGEFRKYRRDEKGNVVKKGDHLMDACRYGIRSGIDRMRSTPAKRGPDMERMLSVDRYGGGGQTSAGWMA